MGLAARLRLARLYLITDARSEHGDLARFLTAAFAGGVDIVQIRQKGMARKAELEALEVARSAAMLIRHRLRQRLGRPCRGVPCRHAASGPDRWSVRSGATAAAPLGAARPVDAQPEQVDAALADPDVNYFFVGPVYATSSNPAFPRSGWNWCGTRRRWPRYGRSLEALVRDRRDRDGHLDDVIAAGARRIAVVRAITLATDPEPAAGN